MTILLSPGQGTSLGSIGAREVEITAFGPQALPITANLARFGIREPSLENWACCVGNPEVWIETKIHTAEEKCRLDLRFVGLIPEAPMAFVFYAKAAACIVGGETLQPKSLRRFQGEAQSVVLHNQLKIEAAGPHKVQVVPLAGDASFWQATFLIAFEIHPLVPQTSFSINFLTSLRPSAPL